MDSVMRALAKQKTQLKEDLFFTVKFAREIISNHYADGTHTMGMLLISAHIIDHFRKLLSFRNWDKGMDIHPEDEIFYTTQYSEAVLKYVDNEYCAKHLHVVVNELESVQGSNLIPSGTLSASCQ
jgi:hypothetical protein